MPSVSLDFFYSFLTMMIVGTILTASFASHANLVRETSEINELNEILVKVASKAEEALSSAVEHGGTVSVVIQLPPKIGNRDYWIRLANDSSRAWVEAGFGRTPRSEDQSYRVYLPGGISASGTFEGRYSRALLICSLNGSVPQITISRVE